MASILLVDDALVARRMLADILQKEGFEICGEAGNGKDAIAKCQQLKPDLITMDMVMPLVDNIDGISAVREIMRNDPYVKIVMVSAMGTGSLMKEAIQAGVKDYIIKPFNAAQVVATIKRVLEA